MRRTNRIGALAAAGLLLAGCYGPFHLTRRLHQWNGQVGDKWVNELVFLAMYIIPFYSVCLAADGLVFNSIEFWTGENPIAQAPKTVHVAKGTEDVTVTLMPASSKERLILQQKQQGQPDRTVRLETRDGHTVAVNEQGDVVFMATTQADGGVVVMDAEGDQVAAYSATDVRHFYESLPQ